MHGLSHPDFIFSLINIIFLEMVDTTPVKTAMPNWELRHRIFCVKWYFKCGSFKKIKEQFGAFFGLDKAPENPRVARVYLKRRAT